MKYLTTIYLFFSSCPAAAVTYAHLENYLRRKSQNNACRVSVRSRFREAEAAWCRAARPASGVWGLNKLPTCYLTGGQLTRAN